MTASTPPDIHHQWLDHLQRQGKSSHTLQAYQRGLEHFAHWYAVTYGEAFTADAVMPRDVRDWKAYQQTIEKAAPATINQRLVALTRFFRWARAQGLCRENPAEDVGTIRLNPRQPQAMEHTVVRKLLRAARDHVRDYALVELLAGTGLRIGELLALTVGDVELNDRSGKVICDAASRAAIERRPSPWMCARHSRAIWSRIIQTKTTRRRRSGWAPAGSCAIAVP